MFFCLFSRLSVQQDPRKIDLEADDIAQKPPLKVGGLAFARSWDSRICDMNDTQELLPDLLVRVRIERPLANNPRLKPLNRSAHLEPVICIHVVDVKPRILKKHVAVTQTFHMSAHAIGQNRPSPTCRTLTHYRATDQAIKERGHQNAGSCTCMKVYT